MQPTEFTFVVPGRPQAKQRPRFSRRGKLAFTSKLTLAAERAWREAALEAVPGGWPTDAEYELDMVFVYKDRRAVADLDNLVKVADGLNPRRRKKVLLEKPFVWDDDRQVVSIIARREIGSEAQTIVTVRVVDR
jgi:Holliday junction resolvase RusA-like endonuclease